MSHHPADRRSQVLSSLQEWSSVSCFPLGEINQAYANYFSGVSYLALLNQTDLPVFNVTFEPGCRNFWHIHHQGGQVLLVTAWARLVPRGGLPRTGIASWRYCLYRPRHKALAWCSARQLVFAHCGGDPCARGE